MQPPAAQPFWTPEADKAELRVKPPSKRNPQRPSEEKKPQTIEVAYNKDTQVRVNNKGRLKNRSLEAEKPAG